MIYEDVEAIRELSLLRDRIIFDLEEHDKVVLPGRSIIRVSRQRNCGGRSSVEKHFYEKEELRRRLEKVEQRLHQYFEELEDLDNAEVADIVYFRSFMLYSWERIDSVLYETRSGNRSRNAVKEYFAK